MKALLAAIVIVAAAVSETDAAQLRLLPRRLSPQPRGCVLSRMERSLLSGMLYQPTAQHIRPLSLGSDAIG